MLSGSGGVLFEELSQGRGRLVSFGVRNFTVYTTLKTLVNYRKYTLSVGLRFHGRSVECARAGAVRRARSRAAAASKPTTRAAASRRPSSVFSHHSSAHHSRIVALVAAEAGARLGQEEHRAASSAAVSACAAPDGSGVSLTTTVRSFAPTTSAAAAIRAVATSAPAIRFDLAAPSAAVVVGCHLAAGGQVAAAKLSAAHRETNAGEAASRYGKHPSTPILRASHRAHRTAGAAADLEANSHGRPPI